MNSNRYIYKSRYILTLFVGFFLLTGCASEPSGEEVAATQTAEFARITPVANTPVLISLVAPFDLNVSGRVSVLGEVEIGEDSIQAANDEVHVGFLCIKTPELPAGAVIESAVYTEGLGLAFEGDPFYDFFVVESVDILDGLDAADFEAQVYEVAIFKGLFSKFAKDGWRGLDHSVNLTFAVRKGYEYYCARFRLADSGFPNGNVTASNLRASGMEIHYYVP